jgi:hypothetical protein
MHKKGITEEVAKKRSRKTVKHQRGIVGADLNAILARRNQTAAERTAARTAAINKAKDAKKEKDAKKDKPKVRWLVGAVSLGVTLKADAVPCLFRLRVRRRRPLASRSRR